MENILAQIINYLLTQSWQIAALIGVIAAVSLAVKNKSAHVRYLLWLIVLAKCLAPGLYTIPLAILPRQEIREPVVTAPVEMPALSIEVVDVTPKDTLMLPPAAVTEPAAPTITERLAEVTVNQWLGFGWIVGAAVFVLVAVIKALRTDRWLKGQRRPLPVELQEEIENFFADVGLRNVPKVWLVKGVGQPFVWGLVRGSIYLPGNFSTSNNNKHRRGVLGHELSHVIRFDAAVNLLQIIAQAVYWFHPFVWWANKKIRAEREKCCDEMAIARLGAKAKDYSVAIVNTLIAEHKSARPVPSLAIAGPVKNIEDRIKTIMKSGRKFYHRPTFITIVVVLVLAAVAVPTTLALTRRAKKESEFKSSNTATISKLLAALEGEKYANIRTAIISMVEEIGDNEPNSFLLEQLGSEDRVRRCNAGLVLELLGDSRGVPAVVKQLQDRSYRPTTRIKSDGSEDQEGQIKQDHYYAALVLGLIGDKRAVPALIEATNDGTINYQAAMSLGQIGDERAIPALRAMMEKFPKEKLWAGYGLAMLGEEGGLEVVIGTLNDGQQDWTKRRHAIEALGKLGNKTAVPHLIAALKDEHPNIRVSAARALGVIGDTSALPALEEALKDKTKTKVNAPTTVSEAAAKAIEQIRAKQKVDVGVEDETGWGEAVEGVRCRWAALVKPVVAGTAPVIALEVENVSDNQIIWQCRSEHTWQIYPRGSERKGEGVYRGTYSAKFRIVRGEGVRLASVDDARRNHEGAGSAIDYYRLGPGARMRLISEYLWVLTEAGQVKIDGYLNRRNPGGGGAYPAEMLLRNRIICPGLVLKVSAGDPAAERAYKVVWSEPVDGLQAGIKYEYGKRPIGYLQDVELSIVMRNITEEPIAVTFSPTGHYDDLPRVRDKDNREQRVEMASDYEKYPPDTVTFPPGFTGSIDVVAFSVCPEDYSGEERRGPILYADPGKYTITRVFRYNLDGGKELNKELTVGPIDLEVVGPGEQPRDVSWGEALIMKRKLEDMVSFRKQLGTRRQTDKRATSADKARARVYKQLDQIVDLSGWNPEMSFSEALEELKNSVKPVLNIVVLWRDLEENAEIDRSTPINMDPISAIRLGTALELLLKSVSAGGAELGYVVQDGVIIIATKESLPSDMVTRVYDIYGFLGPPDGKVQDRVKDLCRLIIDTIEPDSWFETGTGEGTITPYEGRKLIVLQTLQVHQKIAALLDKMRKTVVGNAVAIESRFMTVSDNFLEDLLPDSDANGVGNIGRRVSYGGEVVLPGSESAVTEFRSQLANAIAHSAVSRTSERYNITLDNVKADFLLRAMQAHRDSKVLTAPKVMVLEGERADIRVQTETPYISGYAEPNSPSEKPEPKHDSIETGMRVQLLVKLPDGGNNILLDVDFEISQLIGFEERMYQEKYPYQMPKTEVVSTSTRLLVPDGGTVLIGGDKIKVKKEDGEQVEGNLLVLIKAESVNAQADEAHTLAELGRPRGF